MDRATASHAPWPTGAAWGPTGYRVATGTILAVSLAACVSAVRPPAAGVVVGPGGPPGPVATASAPRPTPSAPAMAAESHWLHDWFGRTPVVIADEPDGAVRLEVPAVHAFEGDAKEPKPALKAVLGRLVQSLQRQPAARLQLSAPGPAAAQRGQALRAHLVGQGIAAWRIAVLPGSAAGQPVRLRLVPGAVGVLRLDDGQLPPPAAGSVTPPPAAPAGTLGAQAAKPAAPPASALRPAPAPQPTSR